MPVARLFGGRLLDLVEPGLPGAEVDSLFDHVGGRETLDRVHKAFYDKVYAHPWFKQFFIGVDQATIEIHQSDFMTSVMGGGKIFCGRRPALAHVHIEVTEELFELRHRMLKESLIACGVSVEHREPWLAIDYKFKPVLVRKKEDCRPRANTISTHAGCIIAVPKPRGC